MHYHAEVWIPNAENVTQQVAEAMAPYEEKTEESYKLTFHWDWYEIGGRWDGVHAPNVTLVAEMPDNSTVYTLVTPEGVFNKDKLNPDYNPDMPISDTNEYFIDTEELPRKWASLLANKDACPGYLVTVDYHS